MTRYSVSRVVARTVMYIILVITAVAIIMPVLIIISSSFKNETDIFAKPMRLIPRDPTLTNFAQLLNEFPRYILNSFKVTTIIVLTQLATATTGAYAFSKLRWRGRDAVFMIYVASIMIPIQAIIIPQFIIIRNLGVYDTHLALVLVSAFTAFGIFLVRQFFLTVPDSLLEAARIDGASEFVIFFRIMLPLSIPVIATLIIFSFRFFWNDFFSPLIYITSRSLKTLPLGLADFVSQYAVLYGPQMAASLISLLPVMVVFLAAQRYFIQGVAATGLKG